MPHGREDSSGHAGRDAERMSPKSLLARRSRAPVSVARSTLSNYVRGGVDWRRVSRALTLVVTFVPQAKDAPCSSIPAMDLPTPRELELETLLRQRDAQVAELTDEVTHLRQFLANQPPPSTTEPTTIPPALMSLLLPLLNEHPSSATSGSTTATTALVQRAKILQEENDELYELLKTGETGRLKEDVRALRRVVQKLEGALRVTEDLTVLTIAESHQVIASLSAELEKSQDALLQAHGRQPPPPHQPSPAPRSHQPPPHLAMGANGSGKLPPTGPRAHKKPRLSESQLSPTASNSSLPLPPKPHLSAANSTPRGVSRDSRASVDRKQVDNVKMEVDDDVRSRQRSPLRERDRPPHHDRERDRDHGRDKDRDRERDRQSDRAKNRDRERERERERDRDQDRSSRRNGNGSGGGSGGGGGGGGGGRRGRRTNGNNNDHANGADRTLAERMGL
ncbi:hypothetical protein ACG7TL_003822 [Trametes sanguinea]